MTRDDILRMARKAGNVQCGCCLPYYDDMEEAEMGDFCVRFAALVAAAERERIIAENAPVIEKINAHIKALENAVVAEREACAKVCESEAKLMSDHKEIGAEMCAAAIRARSNT